MLYTTKENVEKYLGITISDNIDAYIEAISRFIDKTTGTKFNADTQPQTRYYDGNGKEEIIIDDFVEISELALKPSLVSDWVVIDSDAYYQYPSNELPKYILSLKPWKSPYATFIKGKQNVRVKARFGYSEVCPSDIELIATILVAGIYNNKIRTDREIKTERIGDYSVSFDEKQFKDYEWAIQTLKKYRRFSSL